jgi:hypothetical protein
MSSFTYEFETEEEVAKMKEKVMKAKLIVLCDMNKHPLSNPRIMRKKEKDNLVKEVKKLIDTKTEEELTTMFNECCIDNLFEVGDYTSYPIYDLNAIKNTEDKLPVPSETPVVMDCGGNLIHSAYC